MDVINFYDEMARLEANDTPGTRDLLKADCFNVEVRDYSEKHTPRLHTCSQDEFTYVLKGEIDMVVEEETHHLKAGEGILVQAGKKHDTRPCEGASWMLVAKEPHAHHFYS